MPDDSSRVGLDREEDTEWSLITAEPNSEQSFRHELAVVRGRFRISFIRGRAGEGASVPEAQLR